MEHKQLDIYYKDGVMTDISCRFEAGGRELVSVYRFVPKWNTYIFCIYEDDDNEKDLYFVDTDQPGRTRAMFYDCDWVKVSVEKWERFMNIALNKLGF